MEIEEAKEKFQITEKEKASLERYINFGHAGMNALIDFNAEKYAQMSKKGWLLPGFDNSKTSEEVGNEVLKLLDEAADVYSIMIKYKNFEEIPRRLLRGTSAKEAGNLYKGKTYNRIMSTTKKEEVAKSFGEYGDSALLRINTEPDIPFINVTELIGEENLDRYEDEYIIAPFTKIKDSKFTSNWQGYKYYDVELGKPELRPFEEGEQDKFKNEIQSKFADIVAISQKYASLEDKSRMLFRQFQNSHNAEDIKYLRAEQDEVDKERFALGNTLREFSTIMKNYVQGIFVERERENNAHQNEQIEEKETITEKEIIVEQEKESQPKDDVVSETIINEAKSREQYINSVIDRKAKQITDQCKLLKEEEQKYYGISQTLGVPFNLYVDNNQIKTNLQTINANKNTIENKVRDTVENGFKTSDNAERNQNRMASISNQISQLANTETTLMNSINKYAEEALNDTKKGVDERIQNEIKNTKLKLLAIKKQEVMNRKISWFGKLRGLDKLKNLDLENINLEEQILMNTNLQVKENYSIQDSLADMRAFSIQELNGQNTQGMQDIINSVKQVFKINDFEIDNRAKMKLNSVPMVINEQNKKVKTSEKIANANNRKTMLMQELNSRYQPYGRNNNFAVVSQSQGLNEFYRTLHRTIEQTTIEDYQVENNYDLEASLPNYENTANPHEDIDDDWTH